VSVSRGLSRVLDEPVNPRKREGKSSPVNAEVMTGVATLKGPRQSAIANVASRLASRSSSTVPLPSCPLSLSFSLPFFLSIIQSFVLCRTLSRFLALLPTCLPSVFSFDNGDGRQRTCSARGAVNHGQREAEARARDLPDSVKN